MQIAIVDANDAGPSREGDIEFRQRMNFDQGFHAEMTGIGNQIGQNVLREYGDNEQDRIGTRRGGLRDHVFIDDKFLAQNGRTGLIIIKSARRLRGGNPSFR